jgi:hypothetical protein
VAAVALSASAAVAQPASPPSATPAPPGPTPPEVIAPPARMTGSVPQTGTTNGVIHPPGGVDPGIQTSVPAPAPNGMPVIPPSGAPGGNPSVQPK